MTAVHVRAGDEVFSGQPLLTLEKLEHLGLIEIQELAVRDLDHALKRAEAQAAIELEWRNRDLERELTDLRLRVTQREQATTQSLAVDTHAASSRRALSTPVSTISSGKPVSEAHHRPAGILFFGASGQTTSLATNGSASPLQPVPMPVPVRVAEATQNGVGSDIPSMNLTDTLLDTLRSEQAHLESVRLTLRDTISEAAGVASLKAHLTDATQQLVAMKSVSREVNVDSPVYGTVGQVRFRQGDDMQSGEVMIRILHTDRRYIMVYLPTRRIHEMQPGHEVELLFPGHQEYRGQIVDVPLLAEESGPSGDSLAAVRIEPAGRLWPAVPVGSQVDVISLK